MQKVKPIPITNFKPNKFDYVLQISDIHIRPLDRHTEYKQVFEKMYVEILKLKEAKYKVLIVICGDTLDHKSKLTPESYQLCAELFTNLSNIFPTLVILGNHDYQSTNKLHNLEPIVYPRKNFLFVQNTGVYDCDNLTICVNSIYDTESPFIKREHIDTNKFCLAVYHGTIVNSKNTDGYTFTNNNSNGRLRTSNDFTGYNLVTLGDIHLYQQVFKNGWYSSSLVQQNYGESYNSHGFLMHKIHDNKEVTTQFINIPNDYGFVTIKIDSNKWTNPDIEFPIKSRVRLLISNTIDNKKQEIINLIKTKTEILDIYTISNDKIMPSYKQITNKTKTIKPVDIILDELKKLDYPQAKKNKLVDLHKNYMKKINLQNADQCMYLWYPISLEFKNLFGYSGDHLNKIEFKTGITSITASNASGKSSIINIIFFTLFNDLLLNPGRTKNSDILNNKEKQGYVKLDIQYGTTIYTIEKEIKRQKNNQIEIHHKVTYIEDNNQITKEQKPATDMLKDLFSNITDFYRCNVLNNRDQSNDFFRMTDGEKIKYLKQSFNLDHFDDLLSFNKDAIKQNKLILTEKETKYKLLNDELTQLNENNDISFIEQLSQLKEDQSVLDTGINELNDKYNTIYKTITLKEKEIVSLNINEAKIKEEIQTIKQKYPNLTITYDLEKLKHDLIITKSQLNVSIELTKEEINEKLFNITTQLNNLKKIKLTTHDKDIIYKSMIQLETNKNQLNKEISLLTNKFKDYAMPKMKTDKTMDEINNEIEQLNKSYKEIPELTKEVIEEQLTDETDINPEEHLMKKANLQKELDTLKKQIEKPSHLIGKCDIKYDAIINHINDLKNKINSLHNIKPKHNINQIIYKKNLKELETIELTCNQLLQKTITDDNIDNYIEQLNSLLTKDKLMTKDYQITKTNLLTPLKTLLTEIKANTFNQDREKFKELSNRKNILTQEINQTKQQIEFNDNIDKLIKENDNINKQNKNIQEQITKYEYYYNSQKIKNITNEINNLDHSFNQFKLKKDLDNINYNIKLDNQIKTLKTIQKYIEYQDYQIKKEEYNTINKKYQQISQQYQLLTFTIEKELYEQQLKSLELNETINQQIEDLNNKIIYESQRRKYKDNQKLLDTIKNNNLLQNELIQLTTDFNEIKTQQIDKQQAKFNTMIKIDALQKKIDKIKQYNQELTILNKDIIKKQLELQLLELYGNIVSPKGLQTTIIKRELKKLEITMNEILRRYTKYSVDINYDIEKSNIEMLTRTDTKEKLSIERLSTYETIILTTAFKRSIGKHINRTRSMLYIIDESMENMDQINFEKVLPELMKMLLEEYSYILIISQRDISHVSDNEIKIEKNNNISRII